MKRAVIFMDTFYKTLYETILYRWIIVNQKKYLKKGIHFQIDPQDSSRLLFQYQNINGIIHFWYSQHLIEETILNQDDELLFYLHYKVFNLLLPRKYILEFFYHLVSYQSPKHIGLSCSCGITSSLFIEPLQQLAQLMNLPYQFDVVSMYDIEKVYHDYDIILLAPQILYLEPRLKMMCQKECIVSHIDPSIFATCQYQAVLDKIQELLNE